MYGKVPPADDTLSGGGTGDGRTACDPGGTTSRGEHLPGQRQRRSTGTNRCPCRRDRPGTAHPGALLAARAGHQADKDDEEKRDHGQATAPQPAPPRLCLQQIVADPQLKRLERDGLALQLWVREPPADGRANEAVIRAVARWADVAPSQVAIVSGAIARHKLVEIEREDALLPPAV